MAPPLATSTPQSSNDKRLLQPGSGGSDQDSISVVSEGSQSNRSVGRRPPQTPPSNFSIHPPELSSDSSDSGSSSSDDDDDIFPPRCGTALGLRDITRTQWHRQHDENNIQEARDFECENSVFGPNGSIHSDAIRRRRQLLEGRADDGPTDVVMCVLWAGGKFAASYYNLETGQLYMLPDIVDSPPDFTILRSIFSQVNPTYILVNKSTDIHFLKVVYELIELKIMPQDDQNIDASISGAPVLNTPSTAVQLYQLASKEYALETCKPRVMSLQLPFEPANLGPAEHIMFVTSLVPLTNEVMVRTVGCLLKFLDKSAIELFQLDLVRNHIQVSDLILLKMDDVVIVDDSAWRSLQIFSTDFHPSSFKQGISTGCKEGLSVYSILNGCVTSQGSKTLRLMLLRPSKNYGILTRRYDVIDYCINTNNLEHVKSMIECLKPIKNIPKLLHRLSLLHATVPEWKQLYQTLYHCLLLGELCHSLDNAPELILDVGNQEFLNILRLLNQEMMHVIDFDASESANRIAAREGLDSELDKKKKQYACLPEIMSIVASEEMAELPSFVTQCCVVYIPEVGYLLAITLWRPDLTEAELKIENLDFRFKTHELAYYKSARMRELDVVLGDCSVAILEKETIIMVRLTETILQNSSSLHKISDLVSELDSLIAISEVAKSNNFTRPIPVQSGVQLQIVNGRHPISDMICEFVPNSTIFKGAEKVVILTGPNASGKSVYLKQVGVIVLMALSGSFVPATLAHIPLFDKICTRVHAVESVSSGFSSFMADVNQMSLAIRSSSRDTLVIIDEFGKGTLEADGLSILTSSVQNFVDRDLDCPTIFLSTHFSSMSKYLSPSPLVKYQSMKFIHENDCIVYLYELKDGNCETSFAAKLAKQQGVPVSVVNRAINLENVTRGRTSTIIIPINAGTETATSVVEKTIEFLQMEFTEMDPLAYMRIIKRNYELMRKAHNIIHVQDKQ